VRLLVDGVEIGIDLEAGATGLRYHWPGATPGEHTAALIVPDADGNAAATRWTFTVGDGPDAAAGLLGGATPGDPSPFEVILLALAALLAAGGLFALARGMLNGRGGRLVPVLATAVIVGGFALVIMLGGEGASSPVVPEDGVPLAAVVVAGEVP
jgi:hypothetical protein